MEIVTRLWKCRLTGRTWIAMAVIFTYLPVERLKCPPLSSNPTPCPRAQSVKRLKNAQRNFMLSKESVTGCWAADRLAPAVINSQSSWFFVLADALDGKHKTRASPNHHVKPSSSSFCIHSGRAFALFFLLLIVQAPRLKPSKTVEEVTFKCPNFL